MEDAIWKVPGNQDKVNCSKYINMDYIKQQLDKCDMQKYLTCKVVLRDQLSDDD